MAGIGTGILIVVGLIFFSFILGFGTEFWEGIALAIQEQQQKQYDQSSASVQDVGNFARDTNTRVCDVRIEFVGTMTDLNPASIDAFNFGEERFLWLGDVRSIFNIYAPHDTDIIEYKWFCKGTATAMELFSFNLQKNFKDVPDFILGTSKTDAEVVRMKFEGFSINTEKQLFDKTGKLQFQGSKMLPIGADFPIEFRVPIFLEDVTEDDYIIRWWNEDYSVNGKDTGTRFNYKLCMPSKSSC